MPMSRLIERLGLHGLAVQAVATAQASVNVPSGNVATKATSNIIDSWTLGERRLIALANIMPLTTAGTGAATVAIYHGSATGSMSAASVGTGTTPMQATVSVPTTGQVAWLELTGSDLIGKNRYLQAQVIPGGALVASVALDLLTEARVNSPSGGNVSALATPVVVADL